MEDASGWFGIMYRCTYGLFCMYRVTSYMYVCTTPTWECDHVFLGEPLRREEGRKVREPWCRGRDVVLGADEARRRRVPPSQRNRRRRPSQLQAINKELSFLFYCRVRSANWQAWRQIDLTATTESRAATVRMSAQDTVCLHMVSSRAGHEPSRAEPGFGSLWSGSARLGSLAHFRWLGSFFAMARLRPSRLVSQLAP